MEPPVTRIVGSSGTYALKPASSPSMTSEYFRVMCLIRYPSLPQNGAICARANVIARLAGYDCDSDIGTSEHAMITISSHMAPARLFQRLDDDADLQRHSSSIRCF